MRAAVEQQRYAATLAAYDCWARTYRPEPHNPLMSIEQQAMLTVWPTLAGRRVLDLASGSGRYGLLAQRSGAREVIALDFSSTMLAQLTGVRCVRADMMRLPFATATFDAVIAGLAVGHADDLDLWVEEIARVLAPGGIFLYSDFHPAAAQAGLKRGFVDAEGRSRTVPHQRFDIDEHRLALAAAGLSIEALREVTIGADFGEAFPEARDFIARWPGLPLVLVIRARR